MMIGYTVLNKSKDRSLLLIHGLFASAGYWLPYLPRLRDHRLIIVNVDYSCVEDVNRYVTRVVQIIEIESGGVVDAVISHSLGTFLASQLPYSIRRKSFEICPVHSAKRKNTINFIGEIKRKVGSSITDSQVQEQLDMVDRAMACNKTNLDSSSSASMYIPDSDPYFVYSNKEPFFVFKGGHFDIENAFSLIP